MRQLPTYQDLSGEQQNVYELPLDGTYLVTGPPGTGKTVMALYRAQQHNRAGRTVVLLSFGRMLNDFMGEGARQLGLGPTQVMAYTLWLNVSSTVMSHSYPIRRATGTTTGRRSSVEPRDCRRSPVS